MAPPAKTSVLIVPIVYSYQLSVLVGYPPKIVNLAQQNREARLEKYNRQKTSHSTADYITHLSQTQVREGLTLVI